MSTITEEIVTSEHDATWASEIQRRVREVESGEAVLIDHEVVMREACERLTQAGLGGFARQKNY